MAGIATPPYLLPQVLSCNRATSRRVDRTFDEQHYVLKGKIRIRRLASLVFLLPDRFDMGIGPYFFVFGHKRDRKLTCERNDHPVSGVFVKLAR